MAKQTSLADTSMLSSKLNLLHDANFPRDPEGRVYHLGVKRGEVANRILSVGDAGRALMIANMFDKPGSRHVIANRGFTVYTGTYKSVPITVVATGMGVAMVDFLMRECRAVVDGTICVLRYHSSIFSLSHFFTLIHKTFGTCGTPQTNIPIGTVVVSDSSFLIRRNPDHWITPSIAAYDISRPVVADTDLTELLYNKMQEHIDGSVMKGQNVTGDSFYSSQGRVDPNYSDDNNELINLIVNAYPEVASLEMETFQIFHLAQCCKKKNVRAGAAVIVLAQRRSNEFLDNDRKHLLEAVGGKACLEALTSFPLTPTEVMSGPECVWNEM